ncbi:hypothetical protein F5883DRAFT_566218 [Diaporthe sp. PMI_573]|nr:hypothetical protein F5883DRAFT_566218 [Diaporthaceae sp. PMI_573]
MSPRLHLFLCSGFGFSSCRRAVFTISMHQFGVQDDSVFAARRCGGGRGPNSGNAVIALGWKSRARPVVFLVENGGEGGSP